MAHTSTTPTGSRYDPSEADSWRLPSKLKVALIGLLFLLGGSGALGATWTVTSTSDSGSGSLRNAVASASNGDTIDFSLTNPATITLSSPISFGTNVTITGPGASALVVSGGDGTGIFIVNAGAVVTISGVTLEHGSYLLGGCLFNAGTLNLESSTVSFCAVGNQLGGGIFNSGTLNITNSRIEGNVAGTTNGEPGYGGGIYNDGGTLNITNSDISNNSAIGGEQLECGGDVTISCGYGGGIYNNSTGTVNLTGSYISQNFASAAGGIMNDQGTGNTAKVTLTNSAVSGNSSIQGGNGIVNFNAMTITGSTINNNTNVTFAGLIGAATGGGIFNGGSSSNNSLTIVNSTIWGNTTQEVIDDTVHTVDSGGGISSGGAMSLTFVTIAGNSGGISLFDDAFAAGSPQLTVKNSIFADNAVDGEPANCSPLASSVSELGINVVSQGYNLADDSTCAEFLVQTGDVNNTPVGLDPNGLQDNGGLTNTVALLSTSNAINAIPPGSCTDTNGNQVKTDQRGVPRPQGPLCDIGAFEYFKSALLNQAVQTYSLIATVQSFSFPPLVQAGLTVPLDAAVNSLNQDNPLAGAVELGAFILEVDILRDGRVITSQPASSLTAPAQQLLDSLL